MNNRLAVFAAVAVWFLAVGCSCRPSHDGGDSTTEMPPPKTASAVRTSRLQKPTQVLNAGFDEIVVESNLQVYNRVGSKNKSKIVLPSNTTAADASLRTDDGKSPRSLVVAM